jgi:hypothetical protein
MNNLATTDMEAGNFGSVGPAIVVALSLATSPENKADIWYHISHIAMHEPWFSLALVYQRVRQQQEACHAAREAVRLDRRFTDAVDCSRR